MATINDSLNPPQPPTRVFYSTGRMLGVADFEADQDYHRGRLARVLMQLYGTGTVSGLLVQTDNNADPAQLEIQVTPGMAIDRLGRIIEVPRTVCIIPQNWLTQQVQAWHNQQTSPVPGQPGLPDPNTAIHDAKNLMVDVFVTFVPCTRGATPCFATQDDYDATDAFQPNRWLDSFAMLLVLRTDSDPLTPLDPWYTAGPMPAAGAALNGSDPVTLHQFLLQASAGPATAPQEYPPGFDATSVFLARILIPATAGTGGAPPVWTLDPKQIAIDNDSRLFLYPAALLARLVGLGCGAEKKS